MKHKPKVDRRQSEVRICQWCERPLPKKMRADAKYCSVMHRKAASNKRRRMAAQAGDSKYTLAHVEGLTPGSHKTVTKLMRDIESAGLFDEYRAELVTQADIAAMLDASVVSVKRALVRIQEIRARAKAAASWNMDADIIELLALDLEQPTDPYDLDAHLEWARQATERFLAFEERFFITPDERTGKLITFIRKPFHREWIMETLLAMSTGGYLQILSPPRHGKSQLMAHFAVWVICRNPNIRILWVGPKESIAARFVDLVKIKLTQDELVRAVLPPGETFEPQKKGGGTTWNKGEFQVACRLPTVVGATMLAVGRNADSILSLNADWIVCDDIENAKSCENVNNRIATRNWFGIDLDSRKMEHTALTVIGSRQHYDDLYGYNLEDPNFRNIVNSAHSLDCRLDPNEIRVHVDCMLFPELRTYKWLMSKKHGAESREAHGTYEMVYLNDPNVSGLTIFDPDQFDACKSVRILGPNGIPLVKGKPVARNRRIAGLDPSATGFQAATAFACTEMKIKPTAHSVTELGMFDVQDFKMKRWVIGMDNRLGGGIENFLILGEQWRVELDIYEWVIEEKGFQNYRRDPRVQAWAKKHGVHIHSHKTEGSNKWHPMYGVGAQSRLFRDELVDLPYGNAESRVLVDILRRAALSFVDSPALLARRKTDTLMSFWFPQKIIRRWEKEYIAEQASVGLSVDNDYPASYPELAGFTNMNTAPWR